MSRFAVLTGISPLIESCTPFHVVVITTLLINERDTSELIRWRDSFTGRDIDERRTVRLEEAAASQIYPLHGASQALK